MPSDDRSCDMASETRGEDGVGSRPLLGPAGLGREGQRRIQGVLEPGHGGPAARHGAQVRQDERHQARSPEAVPQGSLAGIHFGDPPATGIGFA